MTVARVCADLVVAQQETAKARRPKNNCVTRRKESFGRECPDVDREKFMTRTMTGSRVEQMVRDESTEITRHPPHL